MPAPQLAHFFKPLRQIIESVNDTFKGHSTSNATAATPPLVTARIIQRILALTTAIWHNDHTGQPIMRQLIAYDTR